jgi:hypothetical protein
MFSSSMIVNISTGLDYILVTKPVSYKKQELLILREYLSSPPVFWCGPCCSSIYFFVLSYYVSLPFEFHVVMSVTIAAQKRCSVRVYLQLFVGGLMSYLRYLCLFAFSGVQYIVLCFSSSCVPYVASFSGLSNFDCPFGIL